MVQSDWARGPPDSIQQKWHSQMLPSLDHYLHAKNLRYHLTHSRDIDDQRIMQSDRTRSTTYHTQAKIGVSDLSLCWWLPSCTKSKVLTDSVHRFWLSKNTAIWLVERIFNYKWRTRCFPQILFSQNHKEHYYAPFLV